MIPPEGPDESGERHDQDDGFGVEAGASGISPQSATALATRNLQGK